jgi:hypothetical protein
MERRCDRHREYKERINLPLSFLYFLAPLHCGSRNQVWWGSLALGRYQSLVPTVQGSDLASSMSSPCGLDTSLPWFLLYTRKNDGGCGAGDDVCEGSS